VGDAGSGKNSCDSKGGEMMLEEGTRMTGYGIPFWDPFSRYGGADQARGGGGKNKVWGEGVRVAPGGWRLRPGMWS